MPAPVNFDPRQLQKKWYHAIDFDIEGNYNKKAVDRYKQAIIDHINASNTQESIGTFRGVMPVYHYFNSITELWVCVDMARNYVSGWKLSTYQYKRLTTSRDVR